MHRLGGPKVWSTECRDPQGLQDQNCFQHNMTHDYQAEYNAIRNKDESAPSLLCEVAAHRHWLQAAAFFTGKHTSEKTPVLLEAGQPSQSLTPAGFCSPVA